MLARLRCTVKTHMANHARMQASLGKRRGASYLEITKTVIRVCIHNLRRPTSYAREDGRQTSTRDNVVYSAFLRVNFEEKSACQTPFRVEQGMSTAPARGKLDLCPRRQCVRCHKTLNQKPLQPHDSPVIWQLRVWQ